MKYIKKIENCCIISSITDIVGEDLNSIVIKFNKRHGYTVDLKNHTHYTLSTSILETSIDDLYKGTSEDSKHGNLLISIDRKDKRYGEVDMNVMVSKTFNIYTDTAAMPSRHGDRYFYIVLVYEDELEYHETVHIQFFNICVSNIVNPSEEPYMIKITKSNDPDVKEGNLYIIRPVDDNTSIPKAILYTIEMKCTTIFIDLKDIEYVKI